MCKGQCEMNDENVDAKKVFCLNEGTSNETVNVCFIPLLSISVLVTLHTLEQVQYMNLLQL